METQETQEVQKSQFANVAFPNDPHDVVVRKFGECKDKLPCGYIDPQGNVYRSFEVRGMTGADRKLLDTKAQQNGSLAITTLLHACVTSIGGLTDLPQSVFSNLSAADRAYLMLCVRDESLGNVITCQINCPACGASNDAEYSLDDLDVYYLNQVQFLSNTFVPFISVDAVNVGVSAKFRIATGVDENIVAPMTLDNPMDAEMTLMAMTLIEWDGNTVADNNFFDDKPIKVVDAVVEAYKKKMPNIDLSPTLKCFGCRRMVYTEIDGLDFLFSRSRAGQ